MGLLTALYTSVTGLEAASQLISVAGNNIANSNTTAFKASRTDFQTQISQTLATGSAPTGTLGGTNPVQVGLGTRIAGVTRNFKTGSLSNTGVNSQLAIEGAGFFVVSDNGNVRYTRDGNFKLDSNFNLTSASGGLIQGYGVDSNYNVIPGVVQNLTIPLGNLTLAEATENVRFSGNLNASGAAAVNGSIINSSTMYTDNTATTQAVSTDALTALFDANGAAMFANGDVITITGVAKGGASLASHTFEVGATNTTSSDANGTTLADFSAFLSDVLGIDTSVTSGSPGVTVSGGQLVINGNTGSLNDIAISNANVVVNRGSSSPTTPLTFTQSATADGESVRTTFVAYDSLGAPLTLDMTVVLETKNNAGTTWRFYAQSEDDSRVARALGNGTLTFDNNGQLLAATGNQMSVQLSGTGAATPQSITLRFDQPAGAVSSLSDTSSQISALSQDGTRFGTLNDFSVDNDGTIRGVFSNGQIRNLGQVVLANFANPQGLVEISSNYFSSTASSGDAVVAAAGQAGTGRIIGGALELSNVDLSLEFINLINASTGFSANSRVLTTGDRMIQELLATVR